MFFDQQLYEGILFLSLKTPTLPPATTTNTLVIGHKRLVVIEPATPYAHEQTKLDTLLQQRVEQGAQIIAILITHHHRDHIGYADQLRHRFHAPLCAHAETAARIPFSIDRELHDQEIIVVDHNLAIRTIFTPGHAPGHLSFFEQTSRIAYVGDLVAGTGSILIDPTDGGDMSAYLCSLQQLKQTNPFRLVPAHGPVIENPQTYIQQYIEHRLLRESKIIHALYETPLTFDALREVVYADTPHSLHQLAARSLEAHLQKLEQENRIFRSNTRIHLKADLL